MAFSPDQTKAIRDHTRREAQSVIATWPKVELSYWSFSLFRECPQKYIILAISRPDVPMVKDNYWAINGSVIHSLWEDFVGLVKEGREEWNAVKPFLHDNLRPYYDRFVIDEPIDWAGHDLNAEEHRRDAIPQLRASVDYLLREFRSHGLIPRDPSTIHSELTFRTPLPDIDALLKGRCDLVFEDPDSLTIVDLKDVWRRSNVNWRQLVWYSLGLEPVFNKPVTRAGFLLTRLEGWSWRNPQRQSYRDNLKAEITEVAEKIRTGPFKHNLSRHHCHRCDAKVFCPEYQQWAGHQNALVQVVSKLPEGPTKF